jgi:hypothetical protein
MSVNSSVPKLVNVSSTDTIAGEKRCGDRVKRESTWSPRPLILFNNSVVFKGMKIGLAGCNKRSKCDKVRHQNSFLFDLSNLSLRISPRVIMKANNIVLANVLGLFKSENCSLLECDAM